VDVVTALYQCGGGARWSRLRLLGVSEHAVRIAVSSGRIKQVARGGYALPDAPSALITAVALGGVTSHHSAARLHGLAVWDAPVLPHVTVPRGSSRTATDAVVHTSALGRGDVEAWRPVTSLRRTLVDCGRALPLPEAVTVLDSATHIGLIECRELQAIAAGARGPGSANLRLAVRHLDPDAQSALESVLRILLLACGADVRSQVLIPGVGRVDFLINGWLVIEGDGFEFHADRQSYRDDRRRATALLTGGYALLRFSWEDVRFRPAWVIDQVLAALRLGGRHDVVSGS
jgi:very-short-patch-repair endonuclease